MKKYTDCPPNWPKDADRALKGRIIENRGEFFLIVENRLKFPTSEFEISKLDDLYHTSQYGMGKDPMLDIDYSPQYSKSW